MVLKPETIQTRLLRLEEVISELARLRDMTCDEQPPGHRWAIERGLHLGAEIIFDIGNHILSASFGVTPETYDDILRQLAEHRVLDAELYARLKGLGGFRNILVHDYLRLDSDRVMTIFAAAPEVYQSFIAAIRKWLSTVA